MKKVFIITLVLMILIASTAFAAPTYYRIRSGDTLWLVAQRFGVNLEELIRWNNIERPDHLSVGQLLIVQQEESQEVQRWIVYEVKSGDTLWRLSREYGVSIQDLIDLNNIKDYRDLYPGRKFIIPVASIQPEPEPPLTSSPVYYLHKVIAGESLWRIARQYGTTTTALFQANGQQRANDLKAGDKMLVPLSADSNMFRRYGETNQSYLVQAGDTIAGIADRYGIPEDLLRRMNGLTDAEARTGRRLSMPINTAVNDAYRLYRANNPNGEYLFDIAFHFDRAIRPLLDANYLTDPNRRLEAGTLLIIPMTPGTEGNWVSYENGSPQGLIQIQ